MKLMIVDDEELTRTGVISSIDWASLGITEVLQADDGLHGLEMARIHRPEIILCDVRMPRMDGIAMLERLENILPDAVPIFMSGYSDKDYLKAAIKLKAVNYIEKPLNIQEIQDAVTEARETYLKKQRSRRGETLQSMETASRLALQLTVPYGANSGIIEQLAGELSHQMDSDTCFTTIIVRLNSGTDLTDYHKRKIFQNFESFVQTFHNACVFTEKHTDYMVYIVFGPERLTNGTLKSIGTFLNRQYEPYGKFVIAAGDSCCGVSRAYRSFESAVILLQRSFFFPAGSFLTAAVLADYSPVGAFFLSDAENDFSKALYARDRNAVDRILENLEVCFCRSSTFMQNEVKDLYYKLFLVLEDARRQLRAVESSRGGAIAEAVENSFTFLDLHHVLEEKIQRFFHDLEYSVEENPTIFMIKEYISRNFSEVTLSVKDISAHVFLSTSYICTFFKNETGKTLNQYLTEYRMEQAKRLLEDPRYKISDISSRVGYSDGHYFGKSFKKYSGLSPSEYREKMMS